MKIFKKKPMQKEIESVLEKMATLSPDTEEYTVMARNLETLCSANSKNKSTMDLNTILVVTGNLVGILMIIYHEQTGVVTSKALGFVLKGRV